MKKNTKRQIIITIEDETTGLINVKVNDLSLNEITGCVESLFNSINNTVPKSNAKFFFWNINDILTNFLKQLPEEQNEN